MKVLVAVLCLLFAAGVITLLDAVIDYDPED